MNEFALIQCCGGYQKLSGELTDEMHVFRMWMTVWNAEVYFQDPANPALKNARNIYNRSSPGQFYTDFKGTLAKATITAMR